MRSEVSLLIGRIGKVARCQRSAMILDLDPGEEIISLVSSVLELRCVASVGLSMLCTELSVFSAYLQS